MKTILVCGGGGFIGHHLAKKLHEDTNNRVVVADIKPYKEVKPYGNFCSVYLNVDLRLKGTWADLESFHFDEIYQLAADMGGAGYVFTGENDYTIMTSSALINIYCSIYADRWGSKVFYTSSACMYPAYNQTDPLNPKCSEDSAYPANPDSEYGWEKLFSERLYLSASRNTKLNIRIARLHNIFGPEGSYCDGREKAPAALSRKVAMAKDGDTIEVWGPGNQTRSFLYIDDCIEGILTLMNSNCTIPINIGSEEMISINDLAKMIIGISGKDIKIKNIDGPVGVMGRNSDNTLARKMISWDSKTSLKDGIVKTYSWISNQLDNYNE